MAELTRYEPLTRTSLALRDLMDRLLDEAFVLPRWMERSFTTGNVSLYETPEAYLAYIPVPGLKAKDLEVTVLDNIVTIRGKSELDIPKDARALMVGIQGGEIEERIRLPGDVDAGKVEARLQDGILMLRVPKAEQVRPHRIPVKGA